MKNQDKNNSLLQKGYFMFILITILLGALSTLILVFFTIRSNDESKYKILEKESSNIYKTISESFSYSNKINTYIGKQIAEHGSEDLNFILKIFRQADKIQNKNSQLLSWSSFDWVDPNNLQLVNSKLGIRKNPPNMSARQYCTRSPAKPWTLQVSFPVLGNPSKSWVIPAGTGITNENGKYLGAIIIGFNLSELSSMVEQRLNDPVSFIVFDENMRTIVKSHDNKIDDLTFYKKDFKRNLFEKQFGKLPKSIVVGDISYSFYHKFNEYPYIVLTGFNKKFLQKEFNDSILPIIIGFISITAFFLIILYVFRTRILVLMNRERELRNSLYNTNISKTKLIRAASHDLKNYIFGISGLSRMILQNKNKPEIAKSEDLKMIQEISAQSEELMGFVEDLLDTNQNEAGGFTLGKIQVCDLIDLIKRMVVLNRNFALENHITLTASNVSDQKILNIKCDIRRLKQILNNLISNSIKYSPAKTKVTIETSVLEERNEICVTVSDEGIGMSQDDIKMALSGDGENIDKSSLDKVIDSHGIGMSIIKELVELHKGRLEIESKKRFGTKIKIYFKAANTPRKEIKSNDRNYTYPISQFKNKSILLAKDSPVGKKVNTFLLRKMGFEVKRVDNGQEVIEELDKNNLTKQKILIVDDQEVNLQLNKIIIENNISNVSCDIVFNGKEAIESFKKENYDLILMDLQMPIMDGFEATKEIKKNNREVPIIAYTSKTSQKSRRKAKESGVDHYISKPISRNILLRNIAKWLNLNYDFNLLKNEINEILKDKKVISADDQSLNNMILTKTLKDNFGIKVDSVKNGDELIKKFKEQIEKKEPYDIILTDINMEPGMDGITASIKIRDYEIENKLKYKTPIIAITGDSKKELIHKFFRSGIDDYNIKGNPDQEELYKIMAFWINERNKRKKQKELLTEKYFNNTQKPKEECQYYDNDYDNINLFNSKISKKDLADIADVFFDNGNKLVSKIRKSYKDDNIKEFCLHTHSLKGIAGNIGAERLYRFCHNLDQASKEVDVLKDSCMEKLEDVFKETKEFLKML